MSKVETNATQQDMRDSTIARQAREITRLKGQKGDLQILASEVHEALYSAGGLLNDPPYTMPEEAKVALSRIAAVLDHLPDEEDL